MLYRITRHTALASAHRPRLIESTHTTTILTRRVFKRVLTSQREFMQHHSIWHGKGYLPRTFYQYD